MQATLAHTIAARCARGAGHGTQVYMSIETYMNEALWNMLNNENVSWKGKLEAFCWFVASLGLSHSSERSCQHIVAVFALATSDLASVINMSAASKLTSLTEMKIS